MKRTRTGKLFARFGTWDLRLMLIASIVGTPVYTTPQSDTGKLAGTVRMSGTQQGIANASVTVSRAGTDTVLSARRTNAEGRFEVSSPKMPGEYSVVIEKVGHVTSVTHLFWNRDRREDVPLPLTLEPLVEVKGRVMFANFQAVSDAAVVIGSPSSNAVDLSEFSVSNHNGEFVASGLRRDAEYRLFATCASLSATSCRGAGVASQVLQTVAPRAMELVLDAAGTSSIVGQLTGQEEQERFAVALSSRDLPQVPVDLAFTDTQGAFTFSGVSPGRYEIHAAGPIIGHRRFYGILGDNPRFGAESLDAGPTQSNVVIRLEPPREVQVLLDVNPESCVLGSSIRLRTLDAWAAPLHGVLAGLSGELKATVVVPHGKYEVAVVQAASGCVARSAAEIVAGDSVVASVVMEAPGSVRGQILSRDGFDLGSRVILRRQSVDADSTETWLTFTDERGNFILPTLPPGEYSIKGSPSDQADMSTAGFVPVTVWEDSETYIELPLSELR